MTLRVSVKTAILQILHDSDTFVVTDFELTSESVSNGAKMRLTYRHGNGYFHAQFPNKQSRTDKGVTYHNVTLQFSPGRLNLIETGTADGEDSLLQEIKEWAERLRVDLMTTPIGREIEEQEQRIQDLYDKIGLKDDEPLAPKETQSLIERIRDLERRMAENIEKHEKDQASIKWRVEELHQQVEALCVIVQQSTKKGAIRALLGRVFSWSKKKENQQLLKDASSTIVGLLGSGQ